MNNQFYTLSAKSLQGKEVRMQEYAGKPMIIVNTASKCGFTPQYKGLEELYRKYKEQGLVILGFPCNQFGHQEPGDERSIAEGCLINYGVTFPMFSKIEVNGGNAHPIYQYLLSLNHDNLGGAIQWNFTKFLIDQEGNVVKRYEPSFEPEAIGPDIEKLLSAK